MSPRVKKILYVCIAASAVVAITIGLMSCGGKNGVLSEIVITPSTPSVASGYSLQLAAQGVLSDGVTYYLTLLTWSSSNPALAQVSADGLVTAATGTTGIVTITATESDSHKNITGRIEIEVASIQSIAVTPVNPGMAVGTAYQFHALATLLLSDGTTTATQDLTTCVTSSLTWTTSSPEIATVLSTPGVAGSGIVTATTVTGQTYTTAIVATDLISGLSGSTRLTVTDTPLASIAVAIASDPTATIVMTGSSPQLVATATYGDLTTSDRTTSMTWSSSDPALATMSTVTAGLVTAGTATGTVTITAADPITGRAGSLALTIH